MKERPINIVRWGSPTYSTAEDIAFERSALEDLGLTVQDIEKTELPPESTGILVANSKSQVNRELLERASELSLVITTTSGFDHIDLECAAEREITVARCPLARRDAVVQTSIAMGLSLLRRIPLLQEHARKDLWSRGELPHFQIELTDQVTVGVVGAGVIGSRVAEVWESLGANVLVSDPPRGLNVNPLELAEQCQLITLHCSLTDSSENLVNDAFLRSMKPGGVLINTARGACVDLDALLRTDHLGGVALDVFPDEPYPELSRLAGQENFIVTPHAAGFYNQLCRALTIEVIDILAAFLKQEQIPAEKIVA